MNCTERLVCVFEEGCCSCESIGYSYLGEGFGITNCTVNEVTRIALWSVNFVLWSFASILAVIALITLNRKSKSSKRAEQVLIFMTFLGAILVCVVALQTINQQIIGFDIQVTVIYWLSQSFSWASLLLRPFFKSETSMARFNAERSKLVKRLYLYLCPIFLMGFLFSPLFLIIQVMNPNDHKWTAYYWWGIAFSTFSYALITLWSSTITDKEFNHAILHGGGSTDAKSKLLMFRNQARRVMIVSVIGALLPGIIATILASNDEYLINAYIGFPCVLIMGSVKTNHLSYVSIKTSVRNNRLAKSKEGIIILEEKPKSKEETINESNTTTTTNNKIIKKLSRRKKTKKKKVDHMSTVREVSNEGTVVATQLDYIQDNTEEDDSKQPQTELITVEEEVHSSSFDGKQNTFES